MRAKSMSCFGAVAPFTMALGVATTLALTCPSWGIDKHWNVVGTGTWQTGGNWSPVGVPGGGDAVFVGSTIAAENGWVNINGNVSMQSLTVTDGMMVDGNTSQVTVGGLIHISGRNQAGQVVYPSRIRVGNGAAANDWVVGGITVADEGDVEIWDGGVLRVNGLLEIEDTASLNGEGTVHLLGNGLVSLRVDGYLSAGIDGLTVTQAGAGLIDLDGSVAGDSTINVTTSRIDGTGFSDLTINGDALADTYDDDFSVSGNNDLTMNITQGWALGSGSEVRLSANSSWPGPARINGSALSFRGSMSFPGTGAHGQFNCPLTLETTANATLTPEDLLECNGNTVIEGGNYVVGLDAHIDFDGSTTVRGGTFTTFSELESEGSVRFNGQTAWDGTINVNGLAQQYGNASVPGPTVINGDTFDFDGAGTTSWSIANGITLNVSSLDPAGFNKVDGPVTITGTFLGKLTVNLAGNVPWIMDGNLSLSGAGGILVTRISGSPFELNGTLDLASKSGIAADTWFRPGSQTTFEAATTQLRLSADSRISAGAVFLGAGELLLPAGSTMLLEDNANTSGVGIVNEGTLAVGNSPGAAFIDRLTNGAAGTFSVELGGYLPATQHDLLFVLAGLTDLDGTMDVKLIDVGNGVFDPQVGDQFIVLRASGGLVGTFQNAPVSYASGNVYFWSLVYDSSTVTLKLDDILPCAADLNSDGIVNGADLGILLAAWGPCKGCQADLNGDGEVGGADLGQLLAAWGPCI